MNFSHRFILASKSPRRQQLLKALGLSFEILTKDISEDYPSEMPVNEVAKYLAEKKALTFSDELKDQTLIAADTTVILGNEILGKPLNTNDARHMLSLLSGKKHEVNTGVCLLSRNKKVTFSETTVVSFGSLTTSQIHEYVENFHPLDKAGSYGIQDCIRPGVNLLSSPEQSFLKKIKKPTLFEDSLQRETIKPPVFFIESIKGAYFNVVGLPIERLYHELEAF